MIQATVIGRLVKDPSKFQFGDGKEGMNFMVISNNSRSYRDDEPKPTFVRGVIFRSNSYFDENMTQGRQVVLIGEITQEERNEDGNLYPMNMTVNEITFGPKLNRSNSSEDYNGGEDEVF